MTSFSKPVPLVIADPFTFIRTGINELIRKIPVFTYAQSASCMDDVFKLLNTKKAGCLLITDDFIAHHNSNCIHAIIEKNSAAKIIILTGQKNIFWLDYWRRQGVMALIHKSNTGVEIKKAMLHIKEKDEIYYCPVIKNIFNTDSVLLEGNKKVILSDRQREVFIRKLQGKPNKIIADELDLTPSTVSTYYREAKAKIRKWKNGNHLDYAIAFGIISYEDFLKKN